LISICYAWLQASRDPDGPTDDTKVHEDAQVCTVRSYTSFCITYFDCSSS